MVWKMLRTLTLVVVPFASLKKMPNNPGKPPTGGPLVLQLGWGRTKGNPVAGPVTVRFLMFIVCPGPALVRTAPV